MVGWHSFRFPKRVKRRKGSWIGLVLAIAWPAMVAAAEIDRQIEEAAGASRSLRGILQQRVQLTSEGGVVTLRGMVQDVEQKALAEKAVRAIPGVARVENQLEVQFSGRERGDGWLELKIRGKLLLEPEVNTRGTHVSVLDGVVTLTGITETDTQRELIEVLARNVEGVKDVRNELRVSSAQANTEEIGLR